MSLNCQKKKKCAYSLKFDYCACIYKNKLSIFCVIETHLTIVSS